MSRARPKPTKPANPYEAVGILPTREALQHGRYALATVEKNGRKVARNRDASPIDRLFNDGLINKGHLLGAEAFEDLHRMVWGTGHRDPIDFRARGAIHETEAMIDRIRIGRGMLARVGRGCSFAAYNRLVDCVIYRTETKLSAALLEALDSCAYVFGTIGAGEVNR